MGGASALNGSATDRLLLLDAHRRATLLGASTELYSEALGDDPLLAFQTWPETWPETDVILVGASLAAAFRPMARDLSTSLAAPGSGDDKLEAAVELLLDEDVRLVDERLKQEQRCGITFSDDGTMVLDGALLDRQGLARCLRPRWVPRRAPQRLIALPSLERALDKGADHATSWILIHDPDGPPRSPKALKCPLTGQRLPLAGADTTRLLNRDQAHNYALWAWLEPMIEAGASVLIGSDRDQLLTLWTSAWFSAPSPQPRRGE